jgi:hypothetical protein
MLEVYANGVFVDAPNLSRSVHCVQVRYDEMKAAGVCGSSSREPGASVVFLDYCPSISASL